MNRIASRNQEKENAIERAVKAEHLSQSYLEMLEDASYLNNEQSNNNVTADQGSTVYHTISTQTPTKSRALNDRNDTNDHNDMSLIDDDMEMQLLECWYIDDVFRSNFVKNTK